MQTEVSVPKAFSVQNENEFFPIRHLMARMNPKLMVVQVATGTHKSGGCTVFWGLAYLDDQPITKKDVETALAEAGFDVQHGFVQDQNLWAEQEVAS